MFFFCIYLFTIFYTLYTECSEVNKDILNKKNKEIFNPVKTLYRLDSINVFFSDNFKDDEILKKNILNILTFKNRDLVNLRNSTISNNINRIKKIFNIVKNVSFEVSEEKNDGSLVLDIRIERYERIKEINNGNEQAKHTEGFFLIMRKGTSHRHQSNCDL